MKKSILIFCALLCATVSAQNAEWSESSRMAMLEMIKKYGPPDLQGTTLAIWRDKGIWKSIEITSAEARHNFPIDHTDVLSQCVSYQVPAEKMDELAAFSGSIMVDRTQGLMCARCDSEANNTLALNLAHDVVSDIKTVDEARAAFGKIVRQKMNGAKPAYMNRLNFATRSSENPDENTTGLTKQDVIKISRKVAGN